MSFSFILRKRPFHQSINQSISHPAVLDQPVGLPRRVPDVLGRQGQARDHGGDVQRRGALADLDRAGLVLVLAAVVAHWRSWGVEGGKGGVCVEWRKKRGTAPRAANAIERFLLTEVARVVHQLGHVVRDDGFHGLGAVWLFGSRLGLFLGWRLSGGGQGGGGVGKKSSNNNKKTHPGANLR